MDETAKNDWQRIRSVFEDVLLKPAEERKVYAEKLCGDDEILWNEVISLLDWHKSSESFLETPAVVQVTSNNQLPDQLIAGQRLLHYEIRKLIGKGGMGEVYLARDTRLDRNVAIKLLRRDLLPHIRASERLLREARAVALLEHPNICHIYEISEVDGFNFIVMQYVVGTTLDEILSGRGIDVDTALDLGAQIAEGLAEAHSQGIIHRDIKPANIIVSDKGPAKILDFGLAKFIEAETGAEAMNRMESAGGVMGTIPYMSPEQILGGPVDARTDVFSYGALLYEMLSGSSAFSRGSNSETVSAILNEEPDWSNIPPALRPVLQRCLAKNRTNRHASAGEIADAIAKIRNQIGNDRSIERPARANITAPNRIDAVTGPADLETKPLYTWQSAGDGIGQSSTGPKPEGWRFLDKWLIPFALASFFAPLVIGLAYTVWQPPSQSPSPGVRQRFYWELTDADRREFIRNRVVHIQTLIGDGQRAVNDESLDGVLQEVNWYVSRRDSLSQEPFKEGLRFIYGRASQYVPLVSEEFEKAKVPPAIGIYQAIVESEYRDCLVSDTGPVGIFQFTKATAEKYGLAPQDRCRVDLSSKAAAAYISYLLSYFGSEHSSWTLAVLSFNQGEDLTRLQIRKLSMLGLTERNYWVISEHREQFEYYNPSSNRYMRRFFAAAVIGETPEMFGLVTPPLSTIRPQTTPGISNKDHLVAIPGGSFTMGHDGSHENEKPAHQETVKPFRMQKTEVTNAEYYQFVRATGYSPIPNHWENGKPLPGEEMCPVRWVNIEDVTNFITWRSKADAIAYRLPTEQEWEFAARNGAKGNLFPWGDRFESRCAFVEQDRNDPTVVGSQTCANEWGVVDLIGNVMEWTSSTAWLYPGSPLEIIKPGSEARNMIRGGSAMYKSAAPSKITSTFRIDTPASTRHAALGFRLVTSQ